MLAAAMVSFMLFTPDSAFSQEDAAKKEELLRKIQELQNKKKGIEKTTEEKIGKAPTSQKSLDEVIDKYEKLYAGCTGKKNERCADILYTLAKLYYDKGRDDYINARNQYEKDMDAWDKNPKGPEPVNPVPDYSKALKYYQTGIKEYPDFEKADEAYLQIGTILVLLGDPDGAKDAFIKLVTRFPNSPRASAAHFRLSEFYFLDRDFTASLKHLEKIKQVELYPEALEMAHYRRAEIYYNRAEFDKAVDLFFSYVENCDNGTFPKKEMRDGALEYLAICFSDMPDGAEKAIAYFKAKGPRPYEDYVIYTVGMKNFNHGQFDQAVSALGTALKKYPNYAEAAVAQQMIVSCFVIRKKYEESNKEREKLVDFYGKGSEWYSRNSGNPVALEKSTIEVRRALGQIPIYYHAEAQKTKNKALFEKALKRYQQYLKDFPGDKWKVYEFNYNMAEIYNALHNYEKAAELYDYVAQQDLSTYPRFEEDLDTLGMEDEQKERLRKEKKKDSPVAISQEDAGYNAIAALDNLRKKRQQESGLNDETSYNTPETQKFLDYIHSFANKFTKSTNAPEVLYLAGNVHYSAKAYDAAIAEFKKIATEYASNKIASKAMRMLANTYAAAGEFNMALQKYRDLLLKEKPNTEAYQEIVDLAAGAMFKNADNIKKSGNLIGAADAYKSIYSDFPTSKIADRGWIEAGTILEEMKNFDLAAMTFKEMGDKFPKSKLLEKGYVRAAENYKKLNEWRKAAEAYELGAVKVPKADFAIPSLSSAADCYKEAAMFEKAGETYEMILQRYPTDKRVPMAIYNGGLLYEKAKKYPKAIELYTVLSTKYTDSEYGAEGAFSVGECYEKMNDYPATAKAFTNYANTFPDNKSKQIVGFSRAAEAYTKMGNYNDAEKNAQYALDIYEKNRQKGDIDAVAASKAFFVIGGIREGQLKELKLTGGNEKDVNQKLKDKTKILESALKAYAKAIEMGIGEWTIRSTYQIGNCFVTFATDLKNQSLFGNQDQKTASKIKIISDLEKYYEKAMEKFHWNINTAYEQNIKNEWVDLSKKELMRMAYLRGRLYEEIGEIFKNAPIPRDMDPEEKEMYKDVLEEKYLQALDQALPKYEEGIAIAQELGIVGTAYVDSVKARIKFINPSSDKINIEIQERAPLPEKEVKEPRTTEKTESVRQAPAPRQSTSQEGSLAQDQLNDALERIDAIVRKNIPDSEKITQLRSIEANAQREIMKEEDTIKEYKNKLGI